MTLAPMTQAHRAALAERVPAGTLGDVPEAYLTEPRGRYHGTAHTLALPRTTAEVATILAYASQHGIGVVPYAGGTGLVAGQTQPDGPLPILLSVERMNRIRDVDAADNVITVEAGVILADIQAAAEGIDRLFPLSLAAQGTARIGGNLATNAGGVQVLRYGNARDLCLGLEAVLADGTIFDGLKRLRKDNTGYDLRHLLIGSEGTLGIITAATLKLFPRPGEVVTAFATVTDPGAAVRLLRRMQDALGDQITAFELLHGTGLEFLADTLPDVAQPFSPRPDWSVLIEVGGAAGSQLVDRAEAALAEAFEAGLVGDALIAQSATQAQAFWAVRESIPAANRRVGAVASHDIAVPVSRIPEFIDRGMRAIAAIDPALRVNAFGHLGDGNLHYNVFPPKGVARERYDGIRNDLTRAVHDLTHAMEGSVSAEHGIGRLKTADLVRYGDPGKLAAMRAIKAALDPKGILNPGAVLGAS